ncbi:hypothetical protein BDW62DRAFT_195797 [Aspergillus aurantiobrunneus]
MSCKTSGSIFTQLSAISPCTENLPITLHYEQRLRRKCWLSYQECMTPDFPECVDYVLSFPQILSVLLQLEILWGTCYTDAEIRSVMKTLSIGLEETYGRCMNGITLRETYAPSSGRHRVES